MSRKINEAGLSLIKRFEGLELKSYHCSAGKLTIGYGHVIMPLEKQYAEITEEKAEEILKFDLNRFEDIVNQLVKVKLNDNQFSSLVALVFNIGGGNFKSSTLLKLLNEEKYLDIPTEFLKWRMAGGKVLKGLIKRRLAEASLFMEF